MRNISRSRTFFVISLFLALSGLNIGIDSNSYEVHAESNTYDSNLLRGCF